ncbi:hypothetical protein CAEBREN_05945 [Caenorhabditis brenneri]|uniref:Uncharacterized protein n=1 Tax=Caenorhabditis brenneri TaxID=135651 RepID=G0P377_CAEBE|nr:hypothetical protein CAEBREN_05945 [Caenorhabditis brenneri]
MLPGTTRPHVIPTDLSPPHAGSIDVNLGSLLLQKFGDLKHLGATMVRNLNNYLRSLDIMKLWNGCNGLHLDLLSELSIDATPRNHHFINNVVPPPPLRRRSVSIQRYFEEKYSIKLNAPHSPLLRDSGGRLYPVEVIWVRIRLF